ncbi:MAG: murein biosynthesis integral membrane protein MurJ [Alphaproteobacteria bacterium]|nr:murein biosynthesis integral membrane protein MurJ [Alphaproteobacteria bacterium]
MNFARSLFTVSGLTVISRIAGFIRDTLTAMLLGAGPEADAFFVANRLPNLFRSLFAEGAFTAAFVPLYTSEAKKNGDEAARRFAGEALALMITILVPLCGLVILLMPYLIMVIAPGFHDEPGKYNMTVAFSRITFPYLLLISVTALQSGVLNARGRFGPPAAAPIALNIVLISALFLAKWLKLPVGETLAWAVTISGAVQATWLSISCYRARLSIPLMLPHLGAATKRLFKQIGPGAVGAGAAQINLLVSTILASTLPTGAISFLFYADRLNQLPLGIVGIAVATTLLPLLSRHEANGDGHAVRHYTSRAIEFSLLLGLPATIGLGLAAQPIIQTLFEHGQFTHTDTVETAKALAAYSLCVPAFLLIKVFSARFFARHDVKTPVKIAVISMIVNVLASLVLIGPLQHVGIALATSIATWINAGQLYFNLRRRGESIADDKLRVRLPRLALSAAGMGAVTLFLVYFTSDWYANARTGHEIAALMIIIGSSIFVYAALLQLTGAMRWREALALFFRKETPHQA